MDKKVYEKTRYDKIYRHKKNKNYIIRLRKPKNTTISKINGEKIFDIEVAKKLIMKYELNINSLEVKQSNSEYFKDLWINYINYCENVSKLAFNTLKKKKSIYHAYLYELDNYKVSKLNREELSFWINNLNASDKQKNTVLTIIKGFLNWCVNQEIIIKCPAFGIKYIRVNKPEMKYWNTEQFKQFIEYINSFNSPNAYMIKTLVLIEFNLGNRIGETRALGWDCIDTVNNKIKLLHSINYNTQSKDYLSSTKNYQSERIVDVSPKLISYLLEYKDYLMDIHGNVNELIFYNYSKKKPYSDTNLRKYFYKYCNEANVPKIRLYDLRHTYVTMMMSEGWELYHISKRIGHKNYATTVDKYGHIEEKLRKEIAETTDKYY